MCIVSAGVVSAHKISPINIGLTMWTLWGKLQNVTCYNNISQQTPNLQCIVILSTKMNSNKSLIKRVKDGFQMKLMRNVRKFQLLFNKFLWNLWKSRNFVMLPMEFHPEFQRCDSKFGFLSSAICLSQQSFLGFQDLEHISS